MQPGEPECLDMQQEELPTDVDNWEPPDRYPALSQEELRIHSDRQVTNLQQAPSNSPRRELLPPDEEEGLQRLSQDGATSLPQTENKPLDELQELSKELARIKLSSNISEAAMDQLMKLFANKREAYGKLLERGEITASYSRSVKPKLLASLPKFYNSVFLKVEDSAQGYHYTKIEGLEAIPEEYFTLPPNGNTTLLRTECCVRMKDLKELYLETHGGRTATNLQQLKNISLSADGVQESKRGSTTFIIVTVRIGTCIYLAHMFDVKIGVAESKPSPKEILR